ncbi:MAG: tail fiber domain-containing protein [Flavitalea sp.]
MKNVLIYILLMVLSVTGASAQTGISSTTITPNSTLEVRGSVALSIRTFTSSTSLDINDYYAAFTGTTDITVSLPDATTCTGRAYWIKNASATIPVPVVTVNTTSSQMIDGQLTAVLDESYEAVRVISDGTGWQIMAQDVPIQKGGTIGGAWNEGGNNVKTAAKLLGSNTNYDFSFITNNIEAIRLSTAGFLGIGTSNPTGGLHFANNSGTEDGDDYIFADHTNGLNTITSGFQIRKSRGVFGTGQNLQAGDTIGQFRFIPRAGGAVNYTGGSGLDAVYQGSGTTILSDLRFTTSNSERLRINENGKVTIDTTAPDGLNPEKLLVEAGHTASYNVISGKGSIDNYLQLNIQNTSSAAFASSDLVATANNGDDVVNFLDMGINSSASNNPAYPVLNGINKAYLYGTGTDFVIGNGSAGYDLIFFTAGTALTNERMRITSGGNIGIGTNAPAEKLSVGGILAPSVDNSFTLGNSTTRWASVWATNGAIQTSDARLKTNIEPLTYGLSSLMAMRSVAYNWKTSPASNHKIGLIAQEVKKVVPEVVIGDETKENLGLNYAELVPVLINSLQQQQHRLDELKAELAELTRNQTN